MNSAERFYNDYIDFLIARGHTREALQVAEHSRARTLAEGLKIPFARVERKFTPEQTAAKSKAVILSYWLKPGRSYLWVVSPQRTTLFTLPPEDEIEVDAVAYGKAVMGPRDPRDTGNASGVKLFRTLIEPAQALIPAASRVIVVGSGALNTLNFDTLLVPQPQLHYWIEDAVISYASAISLLSGSNRTPPKALVTTLPLIGSAG